MTGRVILGKPSPNGLQQHGPRRGGTPISPPVAVPLAPLIIGGVTIPRGKRVRLDLPVARLTTGTMMSLPVTVISGSNPGPRLWLSAAIHGDELNGVDIIRRVARALRPNRLNGTVIAVPVVNVFGLLEQSRYLPDRRDLNRAFPGSARGSMASRLADLFMQQVVRQCTHGIDLHTAAIHRINLPQVRADLEDPATYDFARAFGAPVMIHSSHRDGSLRQAAARCKIPTLLYEAGEALRFDETAIQTGVDGIYRALAHLGMYTPPPLPPPASLVVRETRWVRASRGGIWHRVIALGDEVKQRQSLGFISDTFGDKPVQVRSPLTGFVIGHSQTPLVNQGDALVHVASVKPDPPKDPLEDPPAEITAETAEAL
jgi:uncharacterized protein